MWAYALDFWNFLEEEEDDDDEKEEEEQEQEEEQESVIIGEDSIFIEKGLCWHIWQTVTLSAGSLFRL